MNTPNSEIKRWGIIVIQSLNHSDVKTGEIQYYDILQKGHGDRYIGSLFRVDEPVPDDLFKTMTMRE